MGASEEFHPEQYRDEVADRARQMIQRKIDGEEITNMDEEQPHAQVIDLMEALKASLAKPRGSSSRASSSKSAPEPVTKMPVKTAESKRKPAKPAEREKKPAARAKAR